jgi:hypothetical protein
MILVTDLVSFVLRHRKNKVFKDWEPWQIDTVIAQASFRNSICVDICDISGTIFGIVIGTPNHSNKVMHIDQILTIHVSTMRKFGQWLRTNYPGYTLTAIRRGKFVDYGKRTEELLERFK